MPTHFSGPQSAPTVVTCLPKNAVLIRFTYEIIGVIITSDLKWRANTTSIVKKAFTRLWMLRRLKQLGATSEELLDVYQKQVRCIVEYASPVWTGGLTQDEVSQIERVQKAAFAIILGPGYKNYSEALLSLDCDSLEERRKSINLKFAKKSLKNDRFTNWFVVKQQMYTV